MAGSLAYAQTVLTDRPRAFFRLNDWGTAVVDRSVYQTANGSVLSGTTQGIRGPYPNDLARGMLFDGISGGVHFTNNFPAITKGLLSIEVWVKPTAIPTLGCFAMLGDDGVGWGLGIGGTSWDSSGSALSCLDAGAGWVTSLGNLPTAGVWYHVVMTRNSPITIAYINGVASTGGNITDASATDLFADIGRESASGGGSGLRFFPGALKDVAFYDYALTPAQVLAHYYAGTLIPRRRRPVVMIPYLDVRGNAGQVVYGSTSN
jgi:Concanavalin A-like lectin/glucanases superfamily